MGGGVPQLRYVIVVDRGELIEASMSVRMRGRANERVRVLVLSVPGCLPTGRYLRLIITLFVFGFPAYYPRHHQTMDGLRAYGWREWRERGRLCKLHIVETFFWGERCVMCLVPLIELVRWIGGKRSRAVY